MHEEFGFEIRLIKAGEPSIAVERFALRVNVEMVNLRIGI